jgi:hypothetical protein
MDVRGLFDAISTMQFKLSKILIEGGVDVNIAVAGVTPLMTACVIPVPGEKHRPATSH